MIDDIEAVQVVASLALVGLAAVLSGLLRLGLTRRLTVASVRAAVQLLAVGFLFGFIIDADRAMVLAWLWVAVMVVVTSTVARRRAPELPGGGPIAGITVAFTVGVCLLVIFGLRVLDYEPVNVIVIAGITIANSMPSQVLGSNRLVAELRDNRGQIEALLALGMSRWQVIRFTAGRIVQTALIPQIEKTNVVGLIALPGAMTGLLLAGADPIDAVLVQLIVMYLVLGAVATSVLVTILIGMSRLFTPDRRLLPLSPAERTG
ncbi:MAG: ABC transporter permease [Actinomycetota bacterium]